METQIISNQFVNAQPIQWPAALAHGSVNAMGTIALLLVTGQPNPSLGSAGIGLPASLPIILLALWLLWRSDVFSEVEEAISRPDAIPVLPSR